MEMEAITHWAGNIVSYLIFLTVLGGILPAHKYEKYIRLFAGCILLLVALKPLTDGLRLEERLNYLFTSLSFENEAGELKSQMDEIEAERRNAVLSQYEAEAEKEAARVASEAGFSVKDAKVELEKDPASEAFATVRSVTVHVEPGQMEEKMEENQANDGRTTGTQETEASRTKDRGGFEQSRVLENGDDKKEGLEVEIEKISKVNISSGEQLGQQHPSRAGQLQGQEEERQWKQEQIEEQPAAAQVVSWADGEKISELQKQLASFYQVEADHVEVRMEP